MAAKALWLSLREVEIVYEEEVDDKNDVHPDQYPEPAHPTFDESIGL